MDGLTLAIDSSTYDGTAALFRDGVLVGECVVAMRGEHEERLMPAIATLVASANAAPGDLRQIVCGGGPGSFTSLRIAASIAKGVARGVGVPLYAVPSLALAAIEGGAGVWLVSLDALRGECYIAGYSWDGGSLTELHPAEVVPQTELAARAAQIGGAVLPARPHARAAGPILGDIAGAGPVSLAEWEPSYGRRAEAQVRWEASHGRPLAP